MSKHHFQIAVVGSGFAGTLTAMIAHRLGFSTALIERGRHPRFVIGESSTPLANLLLEEISQEYDLPFLRPLCKWGSWQNELPGIACGLKRGFTFYHHEFGKPYFTNSQRENQLLVGASPNEAIADTHWYRPEFDHYLVNEARKLGVTYLDETALGMAREESGCLHLVGSRHGEPMQITAEFVLDATGPRGFLHQALGLPETPFPAFPGTQALFSHFRDVGGLPECFSTPGQTPPYPPEQAAVHHVFPGGWIWVLTFNNGLTSAGVAATAAVGDELDFRSGAPGWQRLMARLPSLAETFQDARAVLPFTHSRRLSFQSGRISGPAWALLPSAAGFVDPLLSTGFPLTLLGVRRIGLLLQSDWRRRSFLAGIQDYSQLTSLELQTTARLVGALYASLDQFEFFANLSLLYFAAASFSETARRLGKPHLANAFLLCRNARFSAQLERICSSVHPALSLEEAANLGRHIREAIAPLDVAGLTDRSRHPWYPSSVSDLLRAGPKLGCTQAEISAMLQKSGFAGDVAKPLCP